MRDEYNSDVFLLGCDDDDDDEFVFTKYILSFFFFFQIIYNQTLNRSIKFYLHSLRN